MRLTLAVIVLLAVLRTTAAAYPEFVFSTGATRCSECHFAPVGGGLINDYGRDEAATTIAGAGDGRFLHGATELPSWIALGGDVRVAGLGTRIRSGNEAAVFPMQADLYARAATGGWSVQATVGILPTIRPAPSIIDEFGSREHYVMYERESKAWYARAGRFLPAFGLRLADHTAFVRRFTGLHTLEESYGLGAGISEDTLDLHVAVMTPLELHPRVGSHGFGATAQLEKVVGDNQSFAVHAKAVDLDAALDVWLGASWKRWIEQSNIWLAAELDTGVITSDRMPTVTRIAAYGAVHYRPAKRWGTAFAVHGFDADLRLEDNDRVALESRFTWFPRAHFELAALVRWSVLARELSSGDAIGFVQIHYFL